MKVRINEWEENNITYYIPSGEDIFAEDWYII